MSKCENCDWNMMDFEDCDKCCSWHKAIQSGNCPKEWMDYYAKIYENHKKAKMENA